MADGCGSNLPGIAEHLPIQEGLDPPHHDPLFIVFQPEFILEVLCDSSGNVVDGSGILSIHQVEIARAIREQILTMRIQFSVPKAESHFEMLWGVPALQRSWVLIQVIHGLQLRLGSNARGPSSNSPGNGPLKHWGAQWLTGPWQWPGPA